MHNEKTKKYFRKTLEKKERVKGNPFLGAVIQKLEQMPTIRHSHISNKNIILKIASF